jgi:hypothetical protein
MKGLILFFVLLFLATGTVTAASWETSALRTANGGLVRVGMPADAARRELGLSVRNGKRGKSGKKSEVWKYRGSDGHYRITVVRGQVAKIVVTPDRD